MGALQQSEVTLQQLVEKTGTGTGLANNHAMDYGAGGIRSTRRALAAAAIKTAGSGENLVLAKAPAYLETVDGRVALIAVSSSFSARLRWVE